MSDRAIMQFSDLTQRERRLVLLLELVSAAVRTAAEKSDQGIINKPPKWSGEGWCADRQRAESGYMKIKAGVDNEEVQM